MHDTNNSGQNMGNNKLPKVLLIEDSPTLSLLYKDYLRDEKIELTDIGEGLVALEYIDKHIPEVVLLDLNLPDINGMEILQHIYHQKLPCTVVIITAHGSVDIAVDAMRFNAFDFLEKPFTAKRLQVTLRNALERQSLENELVQYRDDFKRNRFHGFIGSSLPMQAVYSIILNAASSKASIFISGESGTGKEVCAEAIHKQSQRNDKPFIALNCASIPRELMESAIFGHIKGAFTGATEEKKGAAEEAQGGTLFLDEICEMDFDLQAKLLRFIQTGTVQKVGSTQTKMVDVRFVCATNRNPQLEVSEGRFREDLFYRLHVIPIELPPLRERKEDILSIAKHFLLTYSQEEHKSFTRLSTKCETIFQTYNWPGNVREMQNVIRNIVVLNDGKEVTEEMLPAQLSRDVANVENNSSSSEQLTGFDDNNPQNDVIRPLWEIERETITRAIALCGDNIPKAAAMLEISPSTIYRKMQAWQTQIH